MANFLERLGLPKKLIWGFLGVMIFMMGDGTQTTWLSQYLTDNGFNAATMFAVYGITVAISSWLSGVVAETIGIRRTMWLGVIIYVLGVIGFTAIGIGSMNYPVLLATYAFKGLGYPLFAYTFMVWITYRTEKATLSSAQGWFWFVFTCGLSVLGSYLGVYLLEKIGYVPTFWSAIIFALVGAFFALILNKCESTNIYASDEDASKDGNKFKEFIYGLSIVKREPKVLAGGIVRIVNTASQFAFVVFMPLYMAQFGVTTGQWASIWGTIFFINIFFNLIFGIVGDKIGWTRTVVWFGCIGCAIAVVLFYYSPVILNKFWFILLCGTLWTICLAAFVPLSAIVPSLVEKEKGAAMSVLNLGAGAAAFVGPLIVRIFETPGQGCGYMGAAITWTLAILYLISALLTAWIKPEGDR